MQHQHGACLQTIKQWGHETHILPNELSELMAPTTCFLHTLKTIIYAKVTFRSERPLC